ncbi:MAG: pyridoxal-phosphate dependent enzyme [Solirubrobacteraceae bacterium]
MTSALPQSLSYDDVRRAAALLDGVARRTPVHTSRTLDRLVGARVSLKAESFQRGGAFKFRGAYNAISSLTPDALVQGVCTASSGNHAQAVAIAASLCGTCATILMPADAPALKRAATESHGAEVIEFDRYAADREQLLAALAHERGLTVVHPYDNVAVMAGQGTVALELLEQAGELDAVIVPVGGGGLISGCATVVKSIAAGCRMIGVEPLASDDVARSLGSGRRERVTVGRTIADGQQTPSPGELTWPVIQALVDEVVTVSDAEIVAAIRFCFERCKLVVEPSGACALAALLAGRVEVDGLRVGVVLSGGNIGAEAFAALLG